MRLRKLQCRDGSWTFYNEEMSEAYHTPLGAAMEAREKFAAACGLRERAKKGVVVILDVCYGLGYNTAAALEVIREANPSCKVVVIGLELDRAIVERSLDLPFPFEHVEVFRKLVARFDKGRNAFSYDDGITRFDVLIGDARERIKEAAMADVVFFDPFSPKKQPELWTMAFLAAVRDRCADGAVLVTYSCARQVRDNLRGAGFLVEDGPRVGRRGPATVGRIAQHS